MLSRIAVVTIHYTTVAFLYYFLFCLFFSFVCFSFLFLLPGYGFQDTVSDDF